MATTKKKGFGEMLVEGIGAVLSAAAENATTTSRHEALKEVIRMREAELVAARKAQEQWYKDNPTAGFWATAFGCPSTAAAEAALEQAKQDLIDFATGKTTEVSS